MFGLHGYGSLISPTSRSTGFGSWHFFCSALGSRNRPLTTSQMGLASGSPESPCVKSKAPGPSVVPAAKEYPSAAGQVIASVPSGRVNSKNAMSWKKWKDLTVDPETGVASESSESYLCQTYAALFVYQDIVEQVQVRSP